MLLFLRFFRVRLRVLNREGESKLRPYRGCSERWLARHVGDVTAAAASRQMCTVAVVTSTATVAVLIGGVCKLAGLCRLYLTITVDAHTGLGSRCDASRPTTRLSQPFSSISSAVKAYAAAECFNFPRGALLQRQCVDWSWGPSAMETWKLRRCLTRT